MIAAGPAEEKFLVLRQEEDFWIDQPLPDTVVRRTSPTDRDDVLDLVVVALQLPVQTKREVPIRGRLSRRLADGRREVCCHVRRVPDGSTDLFDRQIKLAGDGLNRFARGEQSDDRGHIHSGALDARLSESDIRVRPKCPERSTGRYPSEQPVVTQAQPDDDVIDVVVEEEEDFLEEVVNLTFVSCNQMREWLRHLDSLRQTA